MNVTSSEGVNLAQSDYRLQADVIQHKKVKKTGPEAGGGNVPVGEAIRTCPARGTTPDQGRCKLTLWLPLVGIEFFPGLG